MKTEVNLPLDIELQEMVNRHFPDWRETIAWEARLKFIDLIIEAAKMEKAVPPPKKSKKP